MSSLHRVLNCLSFLHLFSIMAAYFFACCVPRILCSSNDWMGPPHNADWSISDVQINATTGQCTGDWVCEHRWPLIKAMVQWRSLAGDAPLDYWWDDSSRLIAFSRTGKTFIAINDNPQKTMDVVLPTGLPPGVYCDVASGSLTQDGTQCTSRTVTGTLANRTSGVFRNLKGGGCPGIFQVYI